MTSRSTTANDATAPHRGSGGLPSPIVRYWMATRPQFLTASVLPVLVGTAWGASMAGELRLTSAVLFLVGFVLGHAAGNVINDVCDDASGNDPINEGRISPFTGGSRVIQDAWLSRSAMSRYAVFLLAGCALTAFYLVPVHGLEVLAFGLAMGVVVLAHHLPPLKLNHRGLAELIVGISFGVAPVCMAAWLQSGVLDWAVVLLSLPVTLWIANVLLVNEVPDRQADAAVGKATMVVLLGAKPALRLHAAITAAAFAAVAWLVLRADLLPLWALIVPGVLSVPAIGTALTADPADRASMARAIKATLTLHAAGSLWLMAGAAV